MQAKSTSIDELNRQKDEKQYGNVVNQAYNLLRTLDVTEQKQAVLDLRTMFYKDLGFKVFGMELANPADSTGDNRLDFIDRRSY